MSKIGLFVELIGFTMLFWDSEIRLNRPPEKGGGFCTSGFEKESQIEKALSFISNEKVRNWLSKHFHGLAFGLVTIGVLFQAIC